MVERSPDRPFWTRYLPDEFVSDGCQITVAVVAVRLPPLSSVRFLPYFQQCTTHLILNTLYTPATNAWVGAITLAGDKLTLVNWGIVIVSTLPSAYSCWFYNCSAMCRDIAKYCYPCSFPIPWNEYWIGVALKVTAPCALQPSTPQKKNTQR